MVCLRCFSRPVLSFLSFWLKYAVTYRIFCRDLRGMWKFFCFLRFFSLYPPFRPRFQPFVDCTAGQTRNTYVGHDNVYMPPPLSLRLLCPLPFYLPPLKAFSRTLCAYLCFAAYLHCFSVRCFVFFTYLCPALLFLRLPPHVFLPVCCLFFPPTLCRRF